MLQRINSAGLALIRRFEQCRLEAYMPTPNDRPTAGWGHTRGVKLGQTYTQVQADTWLMAEDIPEAERVINESVTEELNPNQFSALVCFVMNVGPGVPGQKDGFVHLKSGRPSTMLAKLNMGDTAGAAAEFCRWNHQAGIVLEGLTRRRQAEEELFRRTIKPLSQSRTLMGGQVAAAGTGLSALADGLQQSQDMLSGLAVYLPMARYALLAVIAIGVAIMIWSRIDDHLKSVH